MRLADGLATLEQRPRVVLGTLAAAQVAGVVVLALTARHNGWVWYQGGDQLWYATSGWLVGRLELAPALVSGGWPLILAPIMWVTGPAYVQALPVIAILDVLVLGPLALLAIYGIAATIGGRLFGYWAAALWVVAPFVAVPLFVDRYHERYVDQFLPQAFGLTAMADFPSMVAVLGAAFFAVRSLERGRVNEAALAGLLAGYAGFIKPPNLLFLAGALLAYVVARRGRELAVFGVAVLPGLLALAIWKQRGLGSLPVLSLGEMHSAASSVVAVGPTWLDRYVDFDVGHWHRQMAELREYFWSARLAQWAPIAGALAVARRSPAAAGLLVGWLGAFLLVKGMSPLASIEANTFFRLLMPAWPAYLLLFASIPFLVPRLLERLGTSAEPIRLPSPSRRVVAVVAVVAALVPVTVVAAARPIDGPERAIVQKPEIAELLTPVDDSLRYTIERRGAARVVRWQPAHWRTDVFYRVYRTAAGGRDVECEIKGAAYCLLRMIVLGTTREPVWIDGSPPPGALYRIGVATNAKDDERLGDVFAVGPPSSPA
jgi:hypothetical protein